MPEHSIILNYTQQRSVNKKMTIDISANNSTIQTWTTFHHETRNNIIEYVTKNATRKEGVRLMHVKAHLGFATFDTNSHLTWQFLTNLVADGLLVKEEIKPRAVMYRIPNVEDEIVFRENVVSKLVNDAIKNIIKKQHEQEKMREKLLLLQLKEHKRVESYKKSLQRQCKCEEAKRKREMKMTKNTKVKKLAESIHEQSIKSKKMNALSSGLDMIAWAVAASSSRTSSDARDDSSIESDSDQFYVRTLSKSHAIPKLLIDSETQHEVQHEVQTETEAEIEAEARPNKVIEKTLGNKKATKKRKHVIEIIDDDMDRTSAASLLIQMREKELARADKRRKINYEWENVRNYFYSAVCDSLGISEGYDVEDTGLLRYDALLNQIEHSDVKK